MVPSEEILISKEMRIQLRILLLVETHLEKIFAVVMRIAGEGFDHELIANQLRMSRKCKDLRLILPTILNENMDRQEVLDKRHAFCEQRGAFWIARVKFVWVSRSRT